MPSRRHGFRAGLTLIELLGVIAIFMVLTALLLGPAGRVLGRMRADQWSEQSSTRLETVIEQLQQRFQGRKDFPLVTLERLEADHVDRLPVTVEHQHHRLVQEVTHNEGPPAASVVRPGEVQVPG